MQYDNKLTGLLISQLRKEKGLTQEVLSGLAGIPRSHLAMIESGRISPTVDTLWKISESLGMKLSAMIAQVEEQIGN